MTCGRVVVVVITAVLAVPAPAAAQSDAPGDSFLGAIRLNPGPPADPAPLPATGASFEVDTSSYGLQPDIHNPPRSGGRQEPNRCAPVYYGKTAWGWLHTDKWVRADVRAGATFDPVLAVMPFISPDRPLLSPGSGACVNRLASGSEDFGDDQPILAPGWYAIQAGGVENAAGEPTGGGLKVQVTLREPPRLTTGARASGRRRSGAVAATVSVSAPRGARVAFSCRRKKCRLPRSRIVSKPGSRRYLRARVVPNGARLQLRVTRVGHIGAYFAWDVRRGRLGSALQRCMEPASSRPRARCDG